MAGRQYWKEEVMAKIHRMLGLAWVMLCVLGTVASCGSLRPDPNQFETWQHQLQQQDEHG